MDRKQHWNHVFETKAEEDVSWFEALPETSLQMLEAAGLNANTCVLDVGGGDSRLVDHLAVRGLDCLAVLDVSGAAWPERVRALGFGPQFRRGSRPTWPESGAQADGHLA